MPQLSAVGVRRTTESRHLERRAWVRHESDRDTVCHPVTSGGGQQWAGQVRDISNGGVGLVLTRRFELGTLLAIEIAGQDGKPGRTLWGRVVHVHPLEPGSWHLGCSFAAELSDDDVRQLL